MILFAVAYLPSYVMPTQISFASADCLNVWMGVFIGIVCISALFNYVTMSILNRIGSVKQMDSYQEVAYNISNSNRGYIFLISAAKFIFLAITASFAIDYAAGYLAQLSLTGRVSDKDKPTLGSVYMIYFAFVFAVAALMFYPYHKVRSFTSESEILSMKNFAYAFSVCFLLQFIFMFVTMIGAAATSDETIKKGDGFLID